jgi:DNA-binding response OmpR family regulator
VYFGPFEADLHTHELWRDGTRIKLVGQPFVVLEMLLESPGSLITRDELRARLWPADTFVSFDHGLNAAVNRLREALGDSATDPVTLIGVVVTMILAGLFACFLPARRATLVEPMATLRNE